MCLMERTILQVWQMGWFSLDIKKPCVVTVCPMNNLFITIYAFLLIFGVIRWCVSLFISFSFVHRFPHIIYHQLLLIMFLMNFFESSKDIFPIVGVTVLFK